MKRSVSAIAMLAAVLAACAPSEPATSVATGSDTGQADTAPTSAAAPLDSTWIGYRAGGNEPFWTLRLSRTTMHFADMGIADSTQTALPEIRTVASGWRLAATANGRPFVAEIERKGCNDSMSGRPFPHTVTVTVNGRTYSGCGGETASLLTGEGWRVVRLDGNPTAATPPTLAFAGDAITGTGGCNTYRAAYRITGEGVEIGPVGATKRACAEPALNQQETRFFGLLDQVTRFDLVDGRLELYAADRAVIVAERAR